MNFSLVLAAVELLAPANGAAMSLTDDVAAERIARETLAKMTLEEKVMLTGGSGTFQIAAIPRLGWTNEWQMSDSSATIRGDRSRLTFKPVGTNDEAIVMTSLEGLASTWNPALARLHGETLGEEAVARGKNQMLGPGVNIHRTPLCGRNWEYFSEDPVLTSRMCVPLIRGLQSRGVAATVKHFALNNQELARGSVDTHVDDRTFHEIYMPAFRAAVKEAGTLALMTSYNKVDGLWASENKYLQKGLLRDQWGFKGFIVSDWGGQHSGAFAVNNGAGLEMSGGKWMLHSYIAYSNAYPLAEAVRTAKVPEETIDEIALHVLYAMAKTGFIQGRPRPKGGINTPEHIAATRRIGGEACVLLKNEKGVLPLAAKALGKVLVIGANADVRQCHLGCSAEGKPLYEITPFAGIRERLKDAEVKLMPFCADLVRREEDGSNAEATVGRQEQKASEKGCDEAELRAAAESADAVIVFVGTELGIQENMESESRDRQSMDLPPAQAAAIRKILGWKLRNCVVVSRSGSPVGYDFTDLAPTMLQIPYLGQEAGHVLADVLFGEVNPSGKLPFTWPKRYADTPVAQAGTYNPEEIVYRERFYVGYRWYDKKGIEPLFPFGHGLSYTTFAYGKPAAKAVKDGWEFSVPVTNTGKVRGKEAVQFYVSAPATVERCVKDLRGFAKVDLAPGETKVATAFVPTRELAYWDVLSHRFRTDAGVYRLTAAASAADLRGAVDFTVAADEVFND